MLRKPWKSAPLVIFVTAGLAGAIAWTWFRDSTGDLLEPRISLSADVLQRHRAKLASSGASSNEKTYALIELARAGDRKARDAALRFAESRDIALRRAAAAALGFYSGRPEQRALQLLVEDPEPVVRESAITSLCQVRSRARKRLLSKVAADDSRPARERLAAWGCELRMNEGEGDDIAAIRKLMEKPGAAETARLAFSYLSSLAPENPVTIDAARAGLSSGDSQMALNSLHYFVSHPSFMKDPSFRTALSDLLKRPEKTLRIAALEALPITCPEDRFKLLGELKAREKDPDVRHSIEEIGATLKRPGTCAITSSSGN